MIDAYHGSCSLSATLRTAYVPAAVMSRIAKAQPPALGRKLSESSGEHGNNRTAAMAPKGKQRGLGESTRESALEDRARVPLVGIEEVVDRGP